MKKLIKFLFVVLGTICLLTGIAGIFVPLLPATPFLLLATACYYKGSDRLYNKLLNSKLGTYIHNYRQKKAIPLKIKILALVMLWLSISSTIFFLDGMLILKLFLVIIAAIASYHIGRLKTLKKFEY